MNLFKPGDTVMVQSIPNHPTDMHRIYDIPTKVRWIGESCIPRTVINKVPGGSIGLVIEVYMDQCKILFWGEALGWIGENNLKKYAEVLS